MKRLRRDVVSNPQAITNFENAKKGITVFEDRIGMRRFEIEVSPLNRKCRYYVRIFEVGKTAINGREMVMLETVYDDCPENAKGQAFFEFMDQEQKRG